MVKVANWSEGTIFNAHKESVSRRTKHIDIAYYFAEGAGEHIVAYYSTCTSQKKSGNVLIKLLGCVLYQRCVVRMLLCRYQKC